MISCKTKGSLYYIWRKQPQSTQLKQDYTTHTKILDIGSNKKRKKTCMILNMSKKKAMTLENCGCPYIISWQKKE